MISIPPDDEFFKSSHSSQGGECMEFAQTRTHAFVRDTKNREELCLALPPQEMVAFLRAAPRPS